MSQERIMVTGGCGFVGSRLVRMLVRQGAGEVVVLDDCSLGVPENLGPARDQVKIVKVDVRDSSAVVEAMNVGGTQSILDGCAESEVKAVVLASTAAVYAPDSAAHHEGSKIAPVDIYGLTKLWSEQLGGLFNSRTNIPVGVARLFNVFGPGETNPHLIPAVIRQVERGDELRLGNLSTKRDYVFVDDVAGGLIKLADRVRETGSMTCNLGREEAVDGVALVRAIGELMGRALNVVTDPARVRESDRPLLLSNCARAHELLEWSAVTTLRSGLAAAVAEPTAAGIAVD
jgi:UDP-glucose 4-epimerase